MVDELNAAPANPTASVTKANATSTPPRTRCTAADAITAPSSMPHDTAALTNPADTA